MHLWYFVCVSKAGGGEHIFDIPEYKKIRVIVDTDAACEADDPYAIVHALLSPKLIVKGICAEHFAQPDSMERSYDEVMTILEAMDMSVPVLKGQKRTAVTGRRSIRGGLVHYR